MRLLGWTIVGSALVLAGIAACTVTSDTTTDGGAAGSSAGTGGAAAGAGGAAAGSGGATAGSGGAAAGAGGAAAGSGGAAACTPAVGADDCEKCLDAKCCTEVTDCANDQGDTTGDATYTSKCGETVDCFNTCDAGDVTACATACDKGDLNPVWNDLIGCLTTNCATECLTAAGDAG
jgi:hypothetical protein